LRENLKRLRYFALFLHQCYYYTPNKRKVKAGLLDFYRNLRFTDLG
jgi:hypothetical protein